MATKKPTDVVRADEVTIVPDQEIEPVVESEVGRIAQEEAFMNEMVMVRVHSTTDDNQPPYVLLNVNGVSQAVLRGHPQPVRRKFVEVLARCKESRYTQHVASAAEPDRIDLRERTALVYPFDVLEDPNPKGRAWLSAVLAERG